ncbi:DUF6630 family protein [Luteimonas deserti]|uniref:DUF6630 domain-containing protein n=1 Tax=Luteimonas deserti TaxID=2752306 RepID=A0A7Z0TXD2_9GAMM|nr:hypothetical protein [Luteimonas deserti]NYZ61222.1 hypothetical protein [Luteimonas deserti]
MHMPADEFDPDDNFAAERLDDETPDGDADIEALVWQWLLLVNPGDAEAAQQQFLEWQEALGGDDDPQRALAVLLDVSDWRSSFRVHEDDRVTLVDAIGTLAARYRVDVDWGIEDPTDPAQLAGRAPGALIDAAHDQLRIADYSLWTWDDGDATVSGVIAARDDDEGVRVVGHALGLDLRPGAG